MSRVSGLVTTIIPVHNRPVLLREAVESVLAQTYRPIEIVIVDDGSTDSTITVASELARTHADVRVITQANAGPGAAREAGRRAATGEFIQLLDSDDLLDAHKFELQVAALRARPGCGVAYSPTRLIHEDGSRDPHPTRRSGEPLETMFPAMLKARCWDTPAPLYRATLFDDAGPWLSISAEEDWEYDCRIASSGVRLAHVPEWLSTNRRHRANLSSRTPESALRDRVTAHEEIYKHARRAGIDHFVPEMQHFARSLFLLSRQCAAAGLAHEAESLFRLSREASGPRGKSAQFRLFALGTRLLGWRMAGRLSAGLDKLR